MVLYAPFPLPFLWWSYWIKQIVSHRMDLDFDKVCEESLCNLLMNEKKFGLQNNILRKLLYLLSNHKRKYKINPRRGPVVCQRYAIY